MKSPIRILAVDGGGVGGMLPARVLERLYAQDARVVQNADLVAGTSTGGLIALGLGVGLAPADLCALYQQHAKDIFAGTYRRYVVERAVLAKYVPDGLRIAVQAIAGDRTLAQLQAKPVLVPVTALLRPDAKHRPAGVFLSTAFRLTGKDSLEKYASGRWKCVDVAISTAAAPTYFPAHEVDDPDGRGRWLCWDGGMIANNPALAALGEVLRLDLAERNVEVRADQTQTPDVRVLSLGTGYRDIRINAGDWGLTQAVQPVISALMDGSVGSTAFLLRQILGRRALRVSVPLTQDYEMDDPGAVDWLNQSAVDFAANDLGAVQQPDGTPENVGDWLARNWFDA